MSVANKNYHKDGSLHAWPLNRFSPNVLYQLASNKNIYTHKDF